MEKERVLPGTRISIPVMMEHLQEDIQLNTWRDFNALIDTYGICCDVISGLEIADSALKVVLAPYPLELDPTLLWVLPGTGLTEGFNYIDVSAAEIVNPPDDETSTLYIKYTGEPYELATIVNAFLYGDRTVTAYTREHASYEFVFDDDPGISGLLLAEVTTDYNGVITSIVDRRGENILKLKHSIFPDTVVKTDRSSTINGDVTIDGTLNLSGNNAGLLEIQNSGLEQRSVSITTGQLRDACEWEHWHGEEVIQGERTVLDSVNAITANSEINNLFRSGIINFQDGYGDRFIVTEIIDGIPDYPWPLNVTLQIPIEDPRISRTLTDLIGSYNLKEVESSHNINANTAINNWMQTIQDFIANDPDAMCSDFYGDSDTMPLASGLWSMSYVYDSAGNIISDYANAIDALGLENSSNPLGTMYTSVAEILAGIAEEGSRLGTQIETLAGQISQQDSIMNTHPAQPGDNRTYLAALYWTDPTYGGSEVPIAEFHVRVIKIRPESSIPDGSELPVVLGGNYSGDIISTNDIRLTNAVKVLTNLNAQTQVISNATSSNIFYVGDTSDMQVGDVVKISSDSNGTSVLHTALVTEIGSDETGDYVVLAAPSPVPISHDYYVTPYRPEWETIPNTGGVVYYRMGVETNQEYIAFVRSVSPLGYASSWSPGYRFNSDNLFDDNGRSLREHVNEDVNIMSTARTIERKTLKRDMETQLLAVQQLVSAMPTQYQFATITETLTTIQATLTAIYDYAVHTASWPLPAM